MARGNALEWWFLALLLATFGVAGALARDFQGEARWLPFGTSVPGALLVVWCGVRLLRAGHGASAGPAHDGEASEPAPAAGRGLRPLLLTLALTLPVAAVGGFLYAVPVCYLSFGLLTQGRAKLRSSALTAAAATVLTWALFGYFLGVPLTRGMF